MKNCKDSIFLASFIIGVLTNRLLFENHFWKADNLIQTIAIWILATSIFTYIFFKILLAIANGGKNEN